MNNQIKQEPEPSHRYIKKSRNSDEKFKKPNDDLEPILVKESKQKIKRMSMGNSEIRMKNHYSSKTSAGRAVLYDSEVLVDNTNTFTAESEDNNEIKFILPSRISNYNSQITKPKKQSQKYIKYQSQFRDVGHRVDHSHDLSSPDKKTDQTLQNYNLNKIQNVDMVKEFINMRKECYTNKALIDKVQK